MHGAYNYRVLSYGETELDAIERYKSQDRHQEKAPRTCSEVDGAIYMSEV